MLSFRPKNILTWDFTVHSHREGFAEPVANISHSLFRDRGRIQLPSRELSIERRGLLRPTYRVLDGDRVILSIDKPSMMRRSYEFGTDGSTWSLDAFAPLRRGFSLRLNGQHVGTIEPSSPLERKGRVTIPEDVPLELRLVCLWLVTLSWKHSAAAASAGS